MSTEIITDNEIYTPLIFSENLDMSSIMPNRKNYMHFDPSTGESFGFYQACSEKNAANKAFMILLRKIHQNEGDIRNAQEIYLREILLDGADKVHPFIVQRVKMQEPTRIDIGNGKVFLFSYKNIIRRIRYD